jgi:hypothetical protein
MILIKLRDGGWGIWSSAADERCFTGPGARNAAPHNGHDQLAARCTSFALKFEEKTAGLRPMWQYCIEYLAKELHWHVEIVGNPSFSPHILRRCRSEMESWADMTCTLRPRSSNLPGSQLVDDAILFDMSNEVYKPMSMSSENVVRSNVRRQGRGGERSIEVQWITGFEDKEPVEYVAYACR